MRTVIAILSPACASTLGSLKNRRRHLDPILCGGEDEAAPFVKETILTRYHIRESKEVIRGGTRRMLSSRFVCRRPSTEPRKVPRDPLLHLQELVLAHLDAPGFVPVAAGRPECLLGAAARRPSTERYFTRSMFTVGASTNRSVTIYTRPWMFLTLRLR